MASPQDGLDLHESTRPSEACTVTLGSECETSGDSMKVRPLLCMWVLDDVFEPTAGRNPQDLYKAYSGTLHSLDRACEETKFEEFGGAKKLFPLGDVAEALGCSHGEGPFNFKPRAVALCAHVANVICLNSFLLRLRIEHFRQGDGDGMPLGLTDELSRLSEKWKLWSGESCKNTFDEWKSLTSGAESCEKTEAMKVLYQWTYPSLHPTFSRVDCELEKAFHLTQAQGASKRSEVELLMGWGDELCHFLEAYKTLYDGGDTEFLFEEIFHFHYNMANFHQLMGNEERRWELLKTIREMLDAIGSNNLKVTKGDKSTIVYLKPDPLRLFFGMWIVDVHEVFEGTDARQYLVQNVFLWEPFKRVKSSSQEEGMFRWYLDLLQLLDRSCEGSKLEGSVLDDEVQLHLQGLKEGLLCQDEVEGFIDLSPEAVGRCVHVANVFSFNCFLVCLRIYLEKSLSDKAVMAEELSNIWRPRETFYPLKNIPFVLRDCGTKDYKTVLTGELSRLADKWKWSGDYFTKRMLKQWNDYLRKATFKEEAKKLLHQCSLLSLGAVSVTVEHEMDDGGYGYAEVHRVSNLGDELCDILEGYRKYFQPAYKGTEFFYDAMYEYSRHTAELHLVLGEKDRAMDLLSRVRVMLESIEEKHLMVTKAGLDGKIEFLQPHPVTRNVRKWNISHLMADLSADVRDSLYFKDIKGSFSGVQHENRGLDFEKFASDQRLIRSHFDRQLYDIIKLVEKERFSEALEAFRALDLETKRSNRATLRKFLEYLNRPEIIFHSCSTSTLTWEAYCRKQDLLIDASKILDDDQLTARSMRQYGTMIAEYSIGKLLTKERRRSLQASIFWSEALEDEFSKAQSDAYSGLNHWLKEEINLRFPSTTPESVEAVISCLRDHCVSNLQLIYKHENLPNMLKACRLLKCSIDIYSDLLRNWMQESRSKEDEWLMLLESQKRGHNALQSYLMEMAILCIRSLTYGNDPSITVSDIAASNADLELYTYTNPEEVDRSVITVFLVSALVWVERGRARTLLNQLGSCYYNTKQELMGNPGSLREELIKFDKDEQAALQSIMSCQTESADNGDTLFVEYWTETLAGDKAVAFLIHNHSIFGQIFGYEFAEVEKLIGDFYKTVPEQRFDRSGSVVQKLHRILEKLYDILIGPWSEHAWFKQLDPKATIVVVPDKMLYRVPFALLRDKKTQKYLFQLHPVAIAPSLRVLQHCERRRQGLEKAPLREKECILAVGNAAYEKNPLPETEVELEELQKCFPGRVKTLQEAEATRAKFLEQLVTKPPDSASTSSTAVEQAFACIHLGVHGHWSEDKGLGLGEKRKDPNSKRHKTGSLQFAKVLGNNSPRQVPGDSSKEMLSSEDIISGEMEWRTPLAVLSACNSSRGECYGDGEINLPRALMVAGVPAAVVSQWKVDDKATPRLMKAFYESLKRGQNVATALQSAMLQLCSGPDSMDNIFEWGSFLVWGLPTVQLPQKLWYVTEARQKTELLLRKFDMVVEDALKDTGMTALCVVYDFLEEAYASNSWTLDDVFRVVDNMEWLISLGHIPCNSWVLGDLEVVGAIFSLIEEVYSVVPPEQLEMVAHRLVEEYSGCSNPLFSVLFSQIFIRTRILYTQAMKGNYQTALEYADRLIEVVESAYLCPADVVKSLEAESIRSAFGDQKAASVRQERAVILRLMRKYEDARREFEDLLAPGEDYACLIQMSCLKYLMGKEDEALEYARRAEILKRPEYDAPGVGAFTLGMKEFPCKYRKWLSNVKHSIRPASPSSA